VGAALVAALAPAPSAAAVPVAKDPGTIACPAASASWAVPAGAGGKQIEDGQTDVHYRPSDAVTVNCNYFTSGGRHILVYVQYALPSDPNPINDFYYGCSSTVTPWNGTDRVYRVTSRDQWAIAVFYDSLSLLKGGEVPMFEGVTRRLLANAEGYAHDCSLRVAPTSVVSTYSFSFDVSGGHASGTFAVEADPGRNPRAATVPVVQFEVPSITLHVSTGGVSRVLAIRVRRGIAYHDYHHGAGTAPPTSRVTFAIEVLRSTIPTCRTGASGTLTVSTSPSVSLRVCGRSFATGRAKTSIAFLR
jgi:hypothetical protein